MELGLALDLLMCNYSSALAYYGSTLCILLIVMHCARLSHSAHADSAPLVHGAARGSYGEHSHTKIAPLPSKITYIKMDPLNPIRNGFANGYPYVTPTSNYTLSFTL